MHDINRSRAKIRDARHAWIAFGPDAISVQNTWDAPRDDLSIVTRRPPCEFDMPHVTGVRQSIRAASLSLPLVTPAAH